MALYKQIKQEDGIVTNYHRILSLTLTTNRQNSIAVLSYVDDYSRCSEKAGTLNQPYQKSITYEIDYNPNMTIESAYEYLKNLPIFNGAEDLLEKDQFYESNL
ncbi:MAG: hypothetical protein NC177_16365 [Ruminococcus flavefaciens]|nr:hypothetical protein [Ruminococcus flavefaciens]